MTQIQIFIAGGGGTNGDGVDGTYIKKVLATTWTLDCDRSTPPLHPVGVWRRRRHRRRRTPFVSTAWLVLPRLDYFAWNGLVVVDSRDYRLWPTRLRLVVDYSRLFNIFNISNWSTFQGLSNGPGISPNGGEMSEILSKYYFAHMSPISWPFLMLQRSNKCADGL